MIGAAGEGEDEIAEAIEVDEGVWAVGFGGHECDEEAFGAAADGAGDVEA